MFMLGLHTMRRKHWDLFMIAHHLFVVVALFGVLHDERLLYLMLPGMGTYAIDRLIRCRRTHFTKVLGASMIGKGGAGEPMLRLTLQADTLGELVPGQHVQVRVANISGFQWHPYSVAAARPLEALAPALARAGWNASQPAAAGAGGADDELTQLEAVSAAAAGTGGPDSGGLSLDVYIKSMAPGSWSDRLVSTQTLPPPPPRLGCQGDL